MVLVWLITDDSSNFAKLSPHQTFLLYGNLDHMLKLPCLAPVMLHSNIDSDMRIINPWF